MKDESQFETVVRLYDKIDYIRDENNKQWEKLTKGEEVLFSWRGVMYKAKAEKVKGD